MIGDQRNLFCHWINPCPTTQATPVPIFSSQIFLDVARDRACSLQSFHFSQFPFLNIFFVLILKLTGITTVRIRRSIRFFTTMQTSLPEFLGHWHVLNYTSTCNRLIIWRWLHVDTYPLTSLFVSRCPDLNWGPTPYHGVALPTELHRHYFAALGVASKCRLICYFDLGP